MTEMRQNTEEIIKGVYLIGGPGITSADDAAIYLLDFSGDLVLIDAGAGRSSSQIVRNIEMLGLNPADIVSYDINALPYRPYWFCAFLQKSNTVH
jgi:predicted RNase H-like nuclease (RuvC/YqgF family)